MPSTLARPRTKACGDTALLLGRAYAAITYCLSHKPKSVLASEVVTTTLTGCLKTVPGLISGGGGAAGVRLWPTRTAPVYAPSRELRGVAAGSRIAEQYWRDSEGWPSALRLESVWRMSA